MPSDRLELIGERCSVLFENGVLSLSGADQAQVEFETDTAYQASYTNTINHSAEALRGGAPFETDRLDNLETIRLVDQAYRLV